VPEICIGVREFKCIGVSPPQDHPHVYINMGNTDTILCPYCATRFRFDPRLTPLDIDPPDSFFADHNAAASETPSPRNRRKARKGKDGDSRIYPAPRFGDSGQRFQSDRMQKLAEALTHNRGHSDNKKTATALKRLLPLTLTAGLLPSIR
jgi:uncharacterized Zn-finger protein